MPAPHNKGNLWLIILSSTLLEQVAVEGGGGVGDGVPVVVPGQNIVLQRLKIYVLLPAALSSLAMGPAS